jgi:hypothetical protein
MHWSSGKAAYCTVPHVLQRSSGTVSSGSSGSTVQEGRVVAAAQRAVWVAPHGSIATLCCILAGVLGSCRL